MSTSMKTLLGAALVAAAAIGTAFPAAEAEARELKFGHLANEQNVWHRAAMKFAEELDRRTDGELQVQVFPNESLGREMDLINGLQLGTVDFTITGESLQNWAPKAALLAIPYALDSLEQLDQVASGPIGEEVEQQIIERAQVRPIAYFARGPRELTSNRPITTPDELNGLRMRVPNVPLFVTVWQELGARPTPMAFSEVFTALQNNTIDAQENPLALIKSANFNEVQSHVNMTDHVRSWIYVVISEQTFNSLDDEHRQAVLDAAQAMQEYERGLFLEDEEQLRADLQERGMTFVDTDNEAFAEKARPVVMDAVDAEVRPLLERIMETSVSASP
ncbi:MAG TPA: TRAP transporter substrate-binding protein [Arenibaculum sp.]|nr:TRAP transporter substrate-binding protein [Arenibaculum sp.]